MQWRGIGWIFIALVALPSSAALAETSELWGTKGESFDPSGRLMDWSYAGYRSSEQPLPELAPTVSVADFGAVPDDGIDDTAAFLDAIAMADGGGVVQVPAGTFIVSQRLTLGTGIVLQGAGVDATTLSIPVSLTDVYGNDGLEGGGTSSYSFSGAFIEASGNFDTDPITTITSTAARGTTVIEVASTAQLRTGQWIRITQTDVEGSLMARLHADLLEGGEDNVGDRGMNFHTRIQALEGTTVTLQRALPLDVDPQWSADVRLVSPGVQEMGVEHLRIEFPLTTYPGHFNEQGFNAIDFSSVMHSWVRDVEIVNADYGVNVRRSHFVTVQDVVLSTSGDRGDPSGHHGLNNGHGSDNLFIDFDVRTAMQHDLTNEWYATGVVFARGRGDDLRMDHHRAAPYSTLWTEIDCGAGQEPFRSGGRSDRGPHTAAYDTLWNVTASVDMALPPDDFGPRMNFVGFRTAATEPTSPYDWWFESIAPGELEPPNLWEAMVQRRLGEPPSTGTGTSSTAGDSSDGDATGDPSETMAATMGSADSTTTQGSGGGSSSTQGSAGTSVGDTDQPSASDDDAGCGCTTDRGRLGGFAWIMFAALLGIRARRPRA